MAARRRRSFAKKLFLYTGIGIAAVSGVYLAREVYYAWTATPRDDCERAGRREERGGRASDRSRDVESVEEIGRAILSRTPRQWTVVVNLNNTYFDNGPIITVASSKSLRIKPGVDRLSLASLARRTDLYLVTTVSDDTSEQACREFLLHLAPQCRDFDTRKVLFTGTIGGRASIARHLDPDVVIESDAGNAAALVTFLHRVIMIDNHHLATSSQNEGDTNGVIHGKSLSQLFGAVGTGVVPS